MVSQAIHMKTNRYVAIKQAPRNSMKTNLEIITLRAASNHPCIVQLLDVHYTEKVSLLGAARIISRRMPYIIMEMAEDNLYEWLTQHGTFSEQDSAMMMHQVV